MVKLADLNFLIPSISEITVLGCINGNELQLCFPRSRHISGSVQSTQHTAPEGGILG